MEQRKPYISEIINKTLYSDKTEEKLMILDVSKTELENICLSKVDEIIKRLKTLKRSAKKKLYICFEGYDTINSDIVVVTQISRWVYALFDKYPYVIYFLAEDYDQSKKLLMCIKCGMDFINNSVLHRVFQETMLYMMELQEDIESMDNILNEICED